MVTFLTFTLPYRYGRYGHGRACFQFHPKWRYGPSSGFVQAHCLIGWDDHVSRIALTIGTRTQATLSWEGVERRHWPIVQIQDEDWRSTEAKTRGFHGRCGFGRSHEGPRGLLDQQSRVWRKRVWGVAEIRTYSLTLKIDLNLICHSLQNNCNKSTLRNEKVMGSQTTEGWSRLRLVQTSATFCAFVLPALNESPNLSPLEFYEWKLLLKIWQSKGSKWGVFP